jgi:DNA mismatch repair protein MSH2
MKPMGSGVLHLTQARHPCLELVDSVSFIPNDVSFSAGTAYKFPSLHIKCIF